MVKPQKPLAYVTDASPGWQRIQRGDGFVYQNQRGQTIRNPRQLERIRLLVIPPAYTDVWICPDPQGHLQATGRDARGRKQYRYHPLWQEQRKQTKFERMAAFAAKLGLIRRRIQRDLKAGDTTQTSVAAAVVRLLDTTALRIGNDSYARENGSFGLTTLRNRHVTMRASRIRLAFKGKSGVEQQVELEDPRVARIVRRCQDLPGQRLFQYVDDAGERKQLRSEHVNAYLHEIAGEDFSAKDFRTWHASVLALSLALQSRSSDAPLTAPDIVRQVAQHLGNTVAVCRKYYIHPLVMEVCEGPEGGARCDAYAGKLRGSAGLREAERTLMAFLATGKRRRKP
ncbi:MULTISPECIES: DNA topoisomerase IB [Comamonas]|uniref:DNA topoisomerase IB n=1 Tax=Comamonas TaxID=283 RepID=UPI000DE6A184|nr:MULTISPECIES: DNA topoisomerase IB [Comamonas]PWB19699.1 DNA topoisomerase [Comamonas sp. JNW]